MGADLPAVFLADDLQGVTVQAVKVDDIRQENGIHFNRKARCEIHSKRIVAAKHNSILG